jgi:RNA polymerase-associated protein LEO1
MSDAALDATLTDDEVDEIATPAENDGLEAPVDTVEENGLDEDEEDLFGDGGDADEPAYVARELHGGAESDILQRPQARR